MAHSDKSVGIIGGAGMLGAAISTALLAAKVVDPQRFWISKRTGAVPDIGPSSAINVTTDNTRLVESCETVILSVPPASFPSIQIDATDKLVISVMAGVTLDKIVLQTGAARVVRAMSSPAASLALAYSPWFASDAVTAQDREVVGRLLGACGATDQVFDESQIDHFTAMTGPVPGFVALFAQCMADHAERQGIDPQVADRAVRQLFLAGGTMLAQGGARPADHVRLMIDYAGTTAAGLSAMIDADISKTISDGLMAAADKAKTL